MRISDLSSDVCSSDLRPVVLVTIGDDDGDFPATDALRYLSRHDIHAELRTVDRGDKTVEERLEQAELAMGAGLIVRGAFGRSRSEGGRVGEECGRTGTYRWSRTHYKKKKTNSK